MKQNVTNRHDLRESIILTCPVSLIPPQNGMRPVRIMKYQSGAKADINFPAIPSRTLKLELRSR